MRDRDKEGKGSLWGQKLVVNRARRGGGEGRLLLSCTFAALFISGQFPFFALHYEGGMELSLFTYTFLLLFFSYLHSDFWQVDFHGQLLPGKGAK